MSCSVTPSLRNQNTEPPSGRTAQQIGCPSVQIHRWEVDILVGPVVPEWRVCYSRLSVSLESQLLVVLNISCPRCIVGRCSWAEALVLISCLRVPPSGQQLHWCARLCGCSSGSSFTPPSVLCAHFSCSGQSRFLFFIKYIILCCFVILCNHNLMCISDIGQ